MSKKFDLSREFEVVQVEINEAKYKKQIAQLIDCLLKIDESKFKNENSYSFDQNNVTKKAA